MSHKAVVDKLKDLADKISSQKFEDIDSILFAVHHGFLCHISGSSRSGREGHVEVLQQRLGFGVGLRGGADDDVHAENFVNLVEVDLGEHDVRPMA